MCEKKMRTSGAIATNGRSRLRCDNRWSRETSESRTKNKRHTRRVAWGDRLVIFVLCRSPSACIGYVEAARAFGRSHSPPRGVPCSLFLQRSPTSPTQRDVGRRVALGPSLSHAHRSHLRALSRERSGFSREIFAGDDTPSFVCPQQITLLQITNLKKTDITLLWPYPTKSSKTWQAQHIQLFHHQPLQNSKTTLTWSVLFPRRCTNSRLDIFQSVSQADDIIKAKNTKNTLSVGFFGCVAPASKIKLNVYLLHDRTWSTAANAHEPPQPSHLSPPWPIQRWPV